MLKFNVFHSSHVNPFMPNIISHPYLLDESIYNFRVAGWYFSFIQILKETFAAYDLILQCLPMSHKKDARLIWDSIKIYSSILYFMSRKIRVYMTKYHKTATLADCS